MRLSRILTMAGERPVLPAIFRWEVSASLLKWASTWYWLSIAPANKQSGRLERHPCPAQPLHEVATLVRYNYMISLR